MDYVNEAEGSNNLQDVNIFERACAFTIELRCLGTRRKLAAGAVKTDADESMVHVSKDILESPRYDDIKRLDADIRKYLENHSVPARSLFRSGVVLVKLDKINEIDAAIELYKERRQELVSRFLEDYGPARERARAKLGKLFDEDDYPELDKVRSSFAFKSKYIEFATPRGLHSISSELYRREAAKMQADVAAATDEIRMVLRAGLRDLTDHLVERLTPKADGSSKVFRDSLVGNVREFLESFESRNIVNDGELAVLVERARQTLDGHGLYGRANDGLREDPIMREAIRQQFEAIKTQLDSMMEQRVRKFDFSE